ncbi:unnamed protein product [Durusdinium trenchii]|uniref:C3H1-type domain-containing protein n=1 Tax=Durusdinium trenchii TaxID=1381693 RepID=A0ABP0QA95_9DINO
MSDHVEHTSSSSSSTTRWVQKLNKTWKRQDEDNEEQSGASGSGSAQCTDGAPSQGDGLRLPLSAAGSVRGDVESEEVSPHTAGTCDPCVYFNSGRGCSKGDACIYCHLPHPSSSVSGQHRPRKLTRDKIKERIERCFEEESEETLHDALQREARKHDYARVILQGYFPSAGQEGVLEPGEVTRVTRTEGNQHTPD